MNTIPIINIHKCDGDGKCLSVCPNNVFELYHLDKTITKDFPLLSRFKMKIKGFRKSRPVYASKCTACGLCVNACHEKAIELISI